MNVAQDLMVLVKLADEEFGIEVGHVYEMLLMPDVTSIPTGAPHARGVITLRGAAIPLIDLRTLFGFPSLRQEQSDLLETLALREQDHINWLHELEGSVREKREFRLATDPHKCKFGQWYDIYRTDSLILGGVLPKFDAPHKQIHAIAQQVVALAAQEQFDAAYAIIEHTRNTQLATMIELFRYTRQVIVESQREIAVVLAMNGDRCAVSVDSVSAVERVSIKDRNDVADVLEQAAGVHLQGIGQTLGDQRLVLLIDAQRLFAGGKPPVALS